ncbi:MAG: hypothetical protein KDG50_08645 [Chromatiales bacterium]|nr:hypothetical protein [Chromatiales bacterium]
MQHTPAAVLPDDLTSYDLLKTLALILMLIDHVGAYFFPEQAGWRIFGRISFPIWLFLVGYSNTRTIPWTLVAGAVVLAASSFVVGEPIFPLSVLVTIIVARLCKIPCADFAFPGIGRMLVTAVLLTALVWPSLFAFEYGALGMLFALYGHAVRHRSGDSRGAPGVRVFMPLSALAYIGYQQLYFRFSLLDGLTMAAGVIAIGLLLGLFESHRYARLTAALPTAMTAVLKLTGRRTLEVYVIHLLAFKVLAALLYPERHSLFELHWY